MAEKVIIDTSKVEARNIGQEVDAMLSLASGERKGFSRKWYDNNFFDDGSHFRYVSPVTGRIVNEKDTVASPRRAIPKASRQIRGMANLILSQILSPLLSRRELASTVTQIRSHTGWRWRGLRLRLKELGIGLTMNGKIRI